MTHEELRFPFGCPVRPCRPSADGRRPVFVLGAYPSALHVRWTPPVAPAGSEPWQSIAAVAVDNEPAPFWEGEDQEFRIAAWMDRVRYDPMRWGTVSPAGHLNGSSGVKVRDRVLDPLGVDRSECWITDCLDTYRCSVDLAEALEKRFLPFARTVGLAPHRLLPHPSQAAIVEEALRDHRVRLAAELDACRPELVVTLGNAALQVLRELLDDRSLPGELAPDAGYGTVLPSRRNGTALGVLPLAHPAAPKEYQDAHGRWMTAKQA